MEGALVASAGSVDDWPPHSKRCWYETNAAHPTAFTKVCAYGSLGGGRGRLSIIG